jgi:DMSO/TMAO reductase YedYZ heme-binding membrane subunit
MAIAARKLSFYCCLVAGMVLVAWTAIEWAAERQTGGPQFDAIVVSGYSAISALTLSLLMSPLRRIAALFGLTISTLHVVAFRRSLGLLAAAMAFVHLLTVVAQHLNGKWIALLENFFLNTGITAALLLLVLTVSSFPSLSRRLGIRLWKELHMLAYAVAIIVAAHLSLSAFAPIWVSKTLVVTVPVLFLLRLIPLRRRTAP